MAKKTKKEKVTIPEITLGKKELAAIAKELNKALGLNPAIDIKGTLEELVEKINEAAALLVPEDELSTKTMEGLGKLGIELPMVGPDSATEGTEDDESGEDEEEEDEEGEDEEEEDEEEGELPAEDNAEEADPEAEEDLDDPEDEEGAENGEEEPVLKQDKKKKEPPLGKKEKTAGVITVIIELIEKAGQKGISKEQILEELIKRFPDRQPTSMKNTVNIQVPTRISKEKFPLEKTPDNKFRRKK